MARLEQIRKLKRLYPTGRAFRHSEGSVTDQLQEGTILSESRAVIDAELTLDSLLPDNDNFTEDDAARLEQFLGLITNGTATLQERKDAIIRKLNHPSDIPARQSCDFIQQQLQLAGFDVYVHCNPLGLTIEEVILQNVIISQQGFQQAPTVQQGTTLPVLFPDQYTFVQQSFQQGTTQQGGLVYKNKVANFIDESRDFYFSHGDVWTMVFFIGGQTLGTFADVPETRKEEFRQTILKLKPCESVAYLLIDYI